MFPVSNINATVFNGAKNKYKTNLKNIEFDDSDDYLIMSANENYLKKNSIQVTNTFIKNIF